MGQTQDKNQKPEIGDLIEIFRGTYQHWALYIGDDNVIHLAPPSHHHISEQEGGGAYKMRVKKEGLLDVVGKDKWKINNLLDKEYEPRPAHEMKQEAESFVDQELPYCVVQRNCEHFVTELRYGKAQSRQVRIAVSAGVTAIALVVLAALTAPFAAMFARRRKEKERKKKRLAKVKVGHSSLGVAEL